MELKRSFSVKNGNGVREYHYEQEPNQQHRKSMEDYCFVQDQFLDTCAKSILFGVFDGHGGSVVSQYVCKQFPTYFSREYKTAKKNAKVAFEKTYQLLDQKMKNELPQSKEMGSTATVGLILLEEAQRVLYISHAGDSSAYLFDDKGGQKITPDHRGDNHSELERVKYKRRVFRKAGGHILQGRIGGMLAVTRSFGDFHLKNLGLTAMPQVKRIQLRLYHRYLIVASDGLWDYVSLQVRIGVIEEVQNRIKEDVEVQDISKALIKKALSNGSTDNISIICLRL